MRPGQSVRLHPDALLGDITLPVNDSINPVLTRFPCLTGEAGPGQAPTPGTLWVRSRKGTVDTLQAGPSSGAIGIDPRGLFSSADWGRWVEGKGSFPKWRDLFVIKALMAAP